MTEPRRYPVSDAAADDSRFTFGLTMDVADVLVRHGYPELSSGLDMVELQQALFGFLYRPSPWDQQTNADRTEPGPAGATDPQTPVSKQKPALGQPREDAVEQPAAAEPEEPPAEDAGEVSFTLEQQFADALGAMFPRDLHEIASSEAYGALKYKVLHRCQETGETPTQVLATVSRSDRAFVARANDPAAFLASRIDS